MTPKHSHGIRYEKEVTHSPNKKSATIKYKLISSPEYHFSSEKINKVLHKKIRKGDPVGSARVFISKLGKTLLGNEVQMIPHHKASEIGIKNPTVLEIMEFYPTRDIAKKVGDAESEAGNSEKSLAYSGIAEETQLQIINDALANNVDILWFMTPQKRRINFMHRYGVEGRTLKMTKTQAFALSRTEMAQLHRKLRKALKEKGIDYEEQPQK